MTETDSRSRILIKSGVFLDSEIGRLTRELERFRWGFATFNLIIENLEKNQAEISVSYYVERKRYEDGIREISLTLENLLTAQKDLPKE